MTKTMSKHELMRARVDPTLKERVARLAAYRQCSPSDSVREAVVRYVEAEEIRLGLPKLEFTQARPKAKK